MSDEEPFIEEMSRNPESRDMRLIYADWLEEQGDPRGRINRLIGTDAIWFCGHNQRKSALDAMHFAWDTQIRVFNGSQHYVAEASQVFHEFAIWIVRELLDEDPKAIDHPSFPHFESLLVAKQVWMIEEAEQKKGLQRLIGTLKRQVPSSELQSMIDSNLSRDIPDACIAIRLAANTTALCAVKYTSRFAQKTRLDRVSLPQQDFQLTQMLIDRCRWKEEK
jgi:uncharacterized protein (TIGR02996 family)